MNLPRVLLYVDPQNQGQKYQMLLFARNITLSSQEEEEELHMDMLPPSMSGVEQILNNGATGYLIDYKHHSTQDL